MSSLWLRRLQSEFTTFPRDNQHLFLIEYDSDVVDLTRWKIGLTGAQGTIYEGEHFTLQVPINLHHPF